MKRNEQPITILVDTREQRPLDFTPFPGVSVETATLWPGDYTVKGFEKSIAFERKSVGDLIGTMKSAYRGRAALRRDRFDDELEEFERHFDRAVVIVEPDPPAVIREAARLKNREIASALREGVSAAFQVREGVYLSQTPPNAVRAFLDALAAEYGCAVYLAASREDAARYLVDFARRYVKSRRHVVHRSEKEAAQPPPGEEGAAW